MTKPERTVDEWLHRKGIDHEHQRRFRIGFVDYFVPDRNLVIEVDGDYWHSRPEQIGKDRARTAYLEKIGVRVIRIAEHDIYADIDKAMEPAGL
jgi:very-short-patch-repair endonuclease